MAREARKERITRERERQILEAALAVFSEKGYGVATIPDIAADTVRIGSSLNSSYPYNQGVSDLFGNIDNVRIFNFTLTLADILRLPTIPTASADLNGDGIVDQADKDIVEANLGPEKLWP